MLIIVFEILLFIHTFNTSFLIRLFTGQAQNVCPF